MFVRIIVHFSIFIYHISITYDILLFKNKRIIHIIVYAS